MGQHLTVYHIKSEIAKACKDSFESLLRKPEGVQDLGFAKDTPFKAQLFISKPKEESELKPPPWVAFLEPGFGELAVPATQSIGAVLFVRIPYGETEEVFAFTFGNGRYFLNSKSYDEDYGLRVALNVIYDYAGGSIEPNRLRSVAAKTVAANTIRTRKQTDRQASFEIFGVDTQHDTLTAVTGTPPVKSGFWGSLLSGSESLATTPGIDWEGLGEYCQEIAETYREDLYKDDFGWIDNLRAVTDLVLLSNLQDELIKMIRDKPADITLTIPEMIEFSDIDHFYFSFNDKYKFLDLDKVSLIDELRKLGIESNLDIGHLESDWELAIKYAQSNDEESWRLLSCLSGEIEYNGQMYILSDGQFFEISNDFLQEINAFIRGLPATKVSLPSCDEGLSEGEYNESTAAGALSLLLLDKKTVRIRGRTTPIEICDLLSDGGCFIHVKRKLNSSSLSHLFAQGFVSADLLLRSQEYRIAALDRIWKEAGGTPTTATGVPSYTTRFSIFDPGEITPRDFEVSYAIIAKWNNKSLEEALPFFSKVNLRRYAEDLRRIGYKVSVARIDVV